MSNPPSCETHHPTARLISDLALADQLEAIGRPLATEHAPTVREINPDGPAADLLRAAGAAVRDMIRQRDEAAGLVESFADFCRAADRGYLGSPLEAKTGLFLADVDASPAYAEPPCTCVPPRTEAENGEDPGATTP